MSNHLNLLANRPKNAVKGKQYLMMYDTDFKTTVVLRQRFFFLPGTVDLFTPITPTIETRLQALPRNCGVPTSLPFEPRQVDTCVNNPNNDQGFSSYTVFIPFDPTSDLHRQAIREIKQLPEIEAIGYTGETHNLPVRNYVRSTQENF